MNKKQIMVRAWELARQGAKVFGGKVREYFASSLSIAWKESKKANEKTKVFEKEISLGLLEVFEGTEGFTATFNGEVINVMTSMTQKGGAFTVYGKKTQKIFGVHQAHFPNKVADKYMQEVLRKGRKAYKNLKSEERKYLGLGE